MLSKLHQDKNQAASSSVEVSIELPTNEASSQTSDTKQINTIRFETVDFWSPAVFMISYFAIFFLMIVMMIVFHKRMNTSINPYDQMKS